MGALPLKTARSPVAETEASPLQAVTVSINLRPSSARTTVPPGVTTIAICSLPLVRRNAAGVPAPHPAVNTSVSHNSRPVSASSPTSTQWSLLPSAFGASSFRTILSMNRPSTSSGDEIVLAPCPTPRVATIHRRFPSMSKHAATPYPVFHQTCRPSVTGVEKA